MIFYKIIVYHIFHRGIKNMSQRADYLSYDTAHPVASQARSSLLVSRLYQTQNLKANSRIVIPGLTYTRFGMASPHTRKAQALKFPKDLPATSEMNIFLKAFFITSMSKSENVPKLVASNAQCLSTSCIIPSPTLAIDPSSIGSLICVLSPVSFECPWLLDGDVKSIEGLRTPAQTRSKLLVGIVRVEKPLWIYSIYLPGAFGLRGSGSMKIPRKTPGQVLPI
jgi:hypothetical protein